MTQTRTAPDQRRLHICPMILLTDKTKQSLIGRLGVGFSVFWSVWLICLIWFDLFWSHVFWFELIDCFDLISSNAMYSLIWLNLIWSIKCVLLRYHCESSSSATTVNPLPLSFQNMFTTLRIPVKSPTWLDLIWNDLMIWFDLIWL